MTLALTPSQELLHAVEKGLLPKVLRCIEQGAGLEERDVCAFTPLIRAAYDNSLDIAQVLLSHGADIHATCEEGWTAVAYALQNGHFDMARLLVDHGANIEYLEFEIGEDLPVRVESMAKIIRNAAGAAVWEQWEVYYQAHCLNQSTPQAHGAQPRPRL